jgi:hypothetical protein
MAIIRKNINEILVSLPKVNHDLYDATSEEMIAKQRQSDGYAVDLLGSWKKVENKNQQKALLEAK